MHASPPVIAATRPKVVLRAEEFDALVEPLGLKTDADKAAFLDVDAGNFSRVRRGQAVSSEFIARTQLKLPKVPFEQLFRIEATS